MKAQQGGGAEITYDFVNQTRQIYIYKMCSLSETFGAGIGGGFSGSIGVSGYIKWLTNIPFYQQNLMSRFAGPSKSQKIGLSGKFELGLGINPSISIGTSKGVEGDCDNVYNLFECPVYFNNQTPKINGVTSIITTVSGAVSAGASSELVAAFSNENGVSCSSGISESYIDYKNGGKNRMYAALKMASEIIINSPIMGLTAVGSSFDLIAASAAITYATIDVENCPLISFATVTTNAITSITQTTAICGGNITSEGGSTVTDRGVCWNTTGSPTPADNHTFNLSVTGSFTANLTGLTANTTYYARAYASNNAGTAYGNERTFTTEQSIGLPTLTSNSITAITQTTATGGGNISVDGGTPVTARGVCWNTIQNPTTANSKTIDGTGTDSFESNLTGLITNTTYYVRAYATNSQGIAYGNEVTFTTSSDGNLSTFADSRDGNVYKTVKIGDQTWMAENLAYDAGNNCWEYENDGENAATYGRLYNLETAKAACPNGWHLPSDNEWEQLAIYINETKGPYSKAGDGDDWNELGKHLKTTTGWSENGNGTNDFGFSGLPGGHRTYGGKFQDIGFNGYWWCSDGNINIFIFLLFFLSSWIRKCGCWIKYSLYKR